MDSRTSSEATLSTIELPTITITEDQLDDSSVVLTEVTLHEERTGESESEFGSEIPEDGGDGGSSQGGSKDKKSALKVKVKRLGSKVKDIFKRGTTPEVSPVPSPVMGEYIDMGEEKRRRKEEEKEIERKRKEEERKRKEEAERKRKEEELERKVAEAEKKAEAEAAREREKMKKEEAKRMKEEEKRKKEEEKRRFKGRDEERNRFKEGEDRKKRMEDEEEQRKRQVEEEKEKRRKWIEEEAEKARIRFEEYMRQKKIEDEEERVRREEQEKREAEEAEEMKKRQKEFADEVKIRKTLSIWKAIEQEVKQEKRREMEENGNDDDGDKTVETADSLSPPPPPPPPPADFGDDEMNDDEKAVRRDEMTDGDERGPGSTHSLVSGRASTTGMSKSTSQVTIMVTSGASVRDKRSPSRGEETFGLAAESEGEGEPDQLDGRKRKKMRKRLRDTKNKLINLKNKTIESLPSMSSLKSKVKDILPARGGSSGAHSGPEQAGEIDSRFSVHREQKTFSEYRKRYHDSENEFFSDSELVESRKSTLKAEPEDQDGVYEDTDTTEDRVQMLLSPINSPLRPPRRSDYRGSFHTSEPNISRNGTPKKPKRAPPPRPPPPAEGGFYQMVSSSSLIGSSTIGPESAATSIGALDEIDLTSSARDLTGSSVSIKKEPKKIPPSIYYRKVVADWQERHLKKSHHDLVSASSPNLETYNCPLRSERYPSSVFGLHHSSPDPNNHNPRPIPRRRSSRASLLRRKMAFESKENIDGYATLGEERTDSPASSRLPPLPPPRLRPDRSVPPSRSPYSTLHRRKLQLQQQQQQRQVQHDYLLTADRANLATDGLYWKPFAWKTGRCRSLTELYMRKRSQPPSAVSTLKPLEVGSNTSLNQEPLENTLSYRLMSQYCCPPRPPPPSVVTVRTTGTLLQSKSSPGKTPCEPIYSTIDRSKKMKRELGSPQDVSISVNGDVLMQSRPLPAPPLPPRSKRKSSFSRSRSNSPYLSLVGSSVDLNPPDATLIKPVSPYPILGMVDASVETGSLSIYTPQRESKECQTSLEDLAGPQKSNQRSVDQDHSHVMRLTSDLRKPHGFVDNVLDHIFDGYESITATPNLATVLPSTTEVAYKSQVAIKVTPEREILTNEKSYNHVNYEDRVELNQLKRTRLSSSSSKDSSPPLVTANSGQVNKGRCVRSKVSPSSGQESGKMEDEASSKTMTSYYDAEDCDTDMDTFADLDSLSTETTATLTASTQFHSVLSELPTISSTSHYDTDEADSKTMDIPSSPTTPVPQQPVQIPAPTTEPSGDNHSSIPSSPTAVPLVAEHVTIEEDSEDEEMLQPRVTSPNEMRAYISRHQMRPDSMDASDPDW